MREVSSPIDPESRGPRILCVVAHPDDEIAFAGTLYATATSLGGVSDVLLITNGEGGYKYSTLAEPVYGGRLTDEREGRSRLPEIRADEMVAGCRWLCVRRIFMLGEIDHRYTQDENEVLGPDADVWDLDFVRQSIREQIERERYDFVLVLAPTATTHGHHKAAAILALESVSSLPLEDRPAVMCVRRSDGDEPPPEAPELEGWPITRIADSHPLVFDRARPFGQKDRLNFKIIANWAIAEHKSQGTMQLLAGGGDRENYWVFAESGPSAQERARAFFRDLAETPVHAAVDAHGGRVRAHPNASERR